MGTIGVARSIGLQNFMAAKLTGNFVLLRVAFNISITGHPSGVKSGVNFLGTLSFHGRMEIQEVVRAYLDTC